jgi:hypothetical protein
VSAQAADREASPPRRGALRDHAWSPPERALVIAAIAIALGSLFVTTYSLALGDPFPRHIDAALVGDAAANPGALSVAERVARGKLFFHRYRTVAAARHALDLQRVYAAMDVTSSRPTLYVSSASGASVARVLERVSTVDPGVRVADAHPLEPNDPNGLDVFYLMLVATIVGFITVLQIQAHAGRLLPRQQAAVVVGLALSASLVFTLVEGPLLHRLQLPILESWGILALQLLAVASFATLMSRLLGRWAILPIWLFFVVLGNSASGGAVAPPLLPRPFAFVSQWLPSGATVTALRNAVYFPGFQQARPLVVLAVWAAGLFAAMMVSLRRRSA